jgi:hypothetical protein
MGSRRIGWGDEFRGAGCVVGEDGRAAVLAKTFAGLAPGRAGEGTRPYVDRGGLDTPP